jgi:putative SOS response-associated peptidase YedK
MRSKSERARSSLFAMKDGRPFTFAGLWEGWKDPESGEWLRTWTIITGEPNERELRICLFSVIL